MTPQTHPDVPPLAGLYQELHSALLSVAALHRAIAHHPDRPPTLRRSHLAAAFRADADIARIAASQGGAE